MKPLLVLSLLVTPIPVLALGAPQQGASEGQQKERLICRQVNVNASGSRVRPQRVCLTRLQWRQRDDVSTDDAEDAFAVRSRDQQTSTYTGDISRGPN